MTPVSRQIILDTETTGLEAEQGHRIIEIGCVELVNRRYTHNNYWHYVNPEREIDEGAMQVHGIRNEFLVGKPKFHELANELWAYLKGAELIIHNAAFDVGFLDKEFGRVGFTQKIADICQVTDTVAMARKMHPGQRVSLDALRGGQLRPRPPRRPARRAPAGRRLPVDDRWPESPDAGQRRRGRRPAALPLRRAAGLAGGLAPGAAAQRRGTGGAPCPSEEDDGQGQVSVGGGAQCLNWRWPSSISKAVA